MRILLVVVILFFSASFARAQESAADPRTVRGGWHQLDVRVKGRRVTVKARPGYLG